MSKWQGKSKASSTGYQIFGFIIKSFGLRPGYFILYFVAFYYYLFSWKSSRAILRFYRERLHVSPVKALRMLYWNYYRLGQTLIDKFAMISGYVPNFTFQSHGAEHLKEIAELGKGGILLSAHMGNYEVAGQLLNRIKVPVNVVMYDGEHEQIKKYLDSSAKKNFKVIFVKNDLSHIFAISAALAANEIVCIHADRFLPGNKTLKANFLGAPALFPEGPFLLALKFGAPVVYVFGFKKTVLLYHLYSSPLKYFGKATGDTVQSIAEDFIKSLEEMVHKFPEQWFNYYDFWDLNHDQREPLS